METLKQSWFIFKTLAKNDKSLLRGRKNAKNKRFSAILSGIIGGIILLVVFAFQFGVMGFSIAKGSEEFLPSMMSVILFMVQLLILLLGLFTVLGTFFYSKDTMLLSSLPLKKSAIFMAKFFRCYISELAISAVTGLVLITSFAVGIILAGVELSVWFFVAEVLSVIILPALPLLLITLGAFPIVYIGSFVKKSKAVKMLFSIVGTILLISLCLLPMLLSQASTGDITNSVNVNIFGAMSTFTVFNMPLANSMFLIDAAPNFFLYFGVMVAGFAATVILSALTYPKILMSLVDGRFFATKRRKQEVSYTPLSFKKTYLKKEIKVIFGTTTLLTSLLLPIVMLPVMIFIFAKTMGDGTFFIAGFILYLCGLISVSSNQVSLLGFSIEGKNVLFLKTLPISAKEMVKLKLKLADIISAFLGLLTFACSAIAMKNVLIAAIIGVIVAGLGVSFNRFGLYNDLKNPFLNWQNIQEISKNNKRSVKPMLTATVCCIVFLAVGAAMEFVPLPIAVKYILFGVTGALAVALIYIFTAKKLFDNADALWERIEA